MPSLLIIKAIGMVAGAAGIVFVLLWVHDEIGDKREAQVRAEFAAATADLNERLLIVAAREESLNYKEALDLDAAVKDALKQFASKPGRWLVDEEEAAAFKRFVTP